MASSQRFRRGVAPSAPARPGVGVASQRLCPGVNPGVAPPAPRPGVAPNSSARPGVASQRLTDGVASVVSHSDVRAFLLHVHMLNLNFAHFLWDVARSDPVQWLQHIPHEKYGPGGDKATLRANMCQRRKAAQWVPNAVISEKASTHASPL